MSDAIQMYSMLFGRALRKTGAHLTTRDGRILWAIGIGTALSLAASIVGFGVPLFLLGLFVYPWCFGEVVRGSRLGWSDVKNSFKRWPVVLVSGFVVLLLLVTLVACAPIALFLFALLPLFEVLSLKQPQGVGDLVEQSISFVASSFLPWALLNLILTILVCLTVVLMSAVFAFVFVILTLATTATSAGVAGVEFGFGELGLFGVLASVYLIGVAALHPALVFRANVFQVLEHRGHRTLLFKYRAGAL